MSVLVGAVGFALFCTVASALEYPIGQPQQHAGMEIGAVYLQPVTMEPEGMMRKASESDIHLEADIHALANNPNGFPEGAWIPYLPIKFEITQLGSKKRVAGELMPMVATDGAHYGTNVKLFGPGKYKLKFSVQPPSTNKRVAFGRHTDRQTGVGAWFQPFDVEYEFVYAGIGKKGGY